MIKNAYVARPTTKECPCFVCNKLTAVVLTSADKSNADWFYICRSHLADTNFCTRVPDESTQSPSSSPVLKPPPVAVRKPESDSVMDLVSSIGSAWSSWRSKKTDEKTNKVSEGHAQEETKAKDTPSQPSSPSPPPPRQPAKDMTPQQPPVFMLHRDFFYLRQREKKKKQLKAHTTQTLANLDFPEVPKSPPSRNK